MTTDYNDFYTLHSRNSSLVLDCRENAPAILYWGVRLSVNTTPEMLALLTTRQEAQACVEKDAPISLSPEMGAGFPDFDDLFTSYRISLNFWLTQWCFGLVSTVDAPQRGREMFEQAIVRLADAARQHQSWELIGDHSWRPRL